MSTEQTKTKRVVKTRTPRRPRRPRTTQEDKNTTTTNNHHSLTNALFKFDNECSNKFESK